MENQEVMTNNNNQILVQENKVINNNIQEDNNEDLSNNPDFLESSIVQDIFKNIDNLEIQLKDVKSVDDAIEIRVKQLAYSKLLVNVYEKDIIYLIRSYANLGITYLENEYFEQAQEHLLNAFKLNESSTDDQSRSLKELQIKILINLSKCYLATNKPQPSISITEKCLKMNETLNGENHISNSDIYYVLAKGNAALKNYVMAEKCFSLMFNMFEQEYGYDSDKCAKICMEIAQVHEMSSNFGEAKEYFTYACKIWEAVLKQDQSEEAYSMIIEVHLKLAEIASKNGDIDSYSILKACEEKYGFKYKDKKKKSLEIKKLMVKYSELIQDFEANYSELIDLEVYFCLRNF